MKQFDLMNAEDLRDMGMHQAETNANKNVPGWSEMALSYLKGFLSLQGERAFLAEDVREYALSNGLAEPPSERAWGGVITRASRSKLIKAVGFQLTKNPKSHCTPARLWQKA